MTKTVANPMVNRAQIDQQLVLHQDAVNLPTLYHPSNIEPHHGSGKMSFHYNSKRFSAIFRVKEIDFESGSWVPHPSG